MRKGILLGLIVLNCFVLTVIIPIQPMLAFADEKSELAPMDLDGTQWAVEVVFVNRKGKKEITQDVLIFEDKTFTSESYKSKGYDLTNYSSSVDEDDATRFGTMQIKGKETSFWKGKIRGKKISGSIHVQRSGGKNVTYYYTGELSSGVLKRKGELKVVAPPPKGSNAEQSIVEKVKAAVKKATE